MTSKTNQVGQLIMLVICLCASTLCGQSDTVAIRHEACFSSIAKVIGTETADRAVAENSEILVAFQLSEGAGITGYTCHGLQNADYGARYLETTLRSLLDAELSACELDEELLILPILLRKDDRGYQSLSLSRAARKKIAQLRRKYRTVVWPFFLIQDYGLH